MSDGIHPSTRTAATEFARQHLGSDDIELKSPTTAQALKAQAMAAFVDNESVFDTVVATDAKGNRLLLAVLDPHATRELNHESAVATAIAFVPVVGAPLAAGLAVKDILNAGVPLMKAKAGGLPTNPTDRALLRMGLKHLGLSTASFATQGAAYYVAGGVKGADAVKDFAEGTASWRDLLKSLLAALKSLFTVGHEHDFGDEGSLRVVVLEERQA